FLGAETGTVTVTSTATGKDVYIYGSILNQSGTTTINSGGAIHQLLGPGSQSVITGTQINLNAASGIGSALAPVNTDLNTSVAGAGLTATTTGGSIHLNEDN